MVFGAIEKNDEKYHTHLKNVFTAIKDRQLDHNFLITDCDCYAIDEKYANKFNKEYCFISGKELTDIVNEYDFQWIWGVFSAFDRSVSLNDILKYKLPCASGNGALWKNPPAIQHPLAEFEIVAFDSCCTLLISKDKRIRDGFMKYFPSSEDLSEYNKNK